MWSQEITGAQVIVWHQWELSKPKPEEEEPAFSLMAELLQERLDCRRALTAALLRHRDLPEAAG